MAKKTDAIDSDIRKFFEENRVMIERIMEEERAKTKEASEAGKADPKEFIEYQMDTAKVAAEEEFELVRNFAKDTKQKTEQFFEGMISALSDPEVQKHFATAGIEILMAIDAVVRSAPMPDRFREAAEKAKDARDAATHTYCQKNPDCAARKGGSKNAQKVNIKIQDDDDQ